MDKERWLRGLRWTAALLLIGFPFAAAWRWRTDGPVRPRAATAEEVVFWHFWGGADAAVVEQVVAQFNASQTDYHVRAVAMPGNNLDLKLFLAVTGGSPPDLINQDDPILGDWVARDAVLPLDRLASAEEIAALQAFLYPTARALGTVGGRPYALCNGLDLRALYYNADLLEAAGLSPPETIEQLDTMAEALTATAANGELTRVGFLPDARRWWAWGTAFGADWETADGSVQLTDPPAVAALRWMDGYRQRLGTSNVLAFRQADQSLPGKTFPLLAGRYAAVMDGQWRVRDIAAHQREARQRGEPVPRFGVCPLPYPPGGRPRAGWLNGNFFLIPRGAAEPAGALAFARFWVGFGGHVGEAARTCAAGGWIPVAPAVAEHPDYQRYLDEHPLMRVFVGLAGSPHQRPYPLVPGAARLKRAVEGAGAAVMSGQATPREAAEAAQRQIAPDATTLP